MITSRGISISAPLLGGVSRPLKKPPGEGSGPTRHADLLRNLVGRVPPRGEPDVFNRLLAFEAGQTGNPVTVGPGARQESSPNHFCCVNCKFCHAAPWSVTCDRPTV